MDACQLPGLDVSAGQVGVGIFYHDLQPGTPPHLLAFWFSCSCLSTSRISCHLRRCALAHIQCQSGCIPQLWQPVQLTPLHRQLQCCTQTRSFFMFNIDVRETAATARRPANEPNHLTARDPSTPTHLPKLTPNPPNAIRHASPSPPHVRFYALLAFDRFYVYIPPRVNLHTDLESLPSPA